MANSSGNDPKYTPSSFLEVFSIEDATYDLSFFAENYANLSQYVLPSFSLAYFMNELLFPYCLGSRRLFEDNY